MGACSIRKNLEKVDRSAADPAWLRTVRLPRVSLQLCAIALTSQKPAGSAG